MSNSINNRNSSIRIGGAGSYSRSFWETAPSGAVPVNFLRAGFRCQAAAILTHVAEHDDAGRVTKAHGGAENVVIGVDDAKRLWVFRVIPGDEGVSWFYQSTPVVRARACFGHVGPDDDRLGILLKTASGSTHWVLPGAVSWDDNENWW